MSAVIIYQGKYGATQQYASWLGESLKMEVKNTASINGEALKTYKVLLLGSSVYIGKLQIKQWLKDNQAFIRDKKIFFSRWLLHLRNKRKKGKSGILQEFRRALSKIVNFIFCPEDLKRKNFPGRTDCCLKWDHC
jgi:menaquinone-dependent protoporphyrinogen IX oxidase